MYLLKNFRPHSFSSVANVKGGLTIFRAFPACPTKAYATTTDPSAPESSVRAAINEVYGQPTHSTHPHLLKANELVPCVRRQELQERRLRLMTFIQQYVRDSAQKTGQTAAKNHLVVIPSATKKYMSSNIPYVFRQNSDFFYLTGCLEPDTTLVMTIDDESKIRSTLFMRPKNEHDEMWDGPRTGVEAAIQMFGVEEARPVDRFPEDLRNHISKVKPFIWYDANLSGLPKVTEEVQKIRDARPASPISFVQNMRLYKSEAEQALMRRTCQIASEAINETISDVRPGQSEHHIYAKVDYYCRMRNASYLAYPPVVAAGNNATTIHYVNNNQQIKSGDMVLMDAGCEYGGYTSDITRTWPVSGNFTEPQRVLYDVVLMVQKEIIDTLFKEGGETLDKLFDTMCMKMGKYLQEAGLIPKSVMSNELIRAGYKFCPHHVSHFLGMDVHDTHLMPRNITISPGMVFTVEPGVYIRHDFTEVPKEFRGMGIRIEDNILVTKDNKIEILTEKCIKDPMDLENLTKARRTMRTCQ